MIGLKDPQLKLERGYRCRDTFVRPDGSEVLCGNDWRRRKQELLKRSDGHCEVCNMFFDTNQMHPHHIRHRWPVRDDRLENLQALCYWCHREAHADREPRWTLRPQPDVT
jgi:5-methylcytosine-specific restriction endonuclease McrA